MTVNKLRLVVDGAGSATANMAVDETLMENQGLEESAPTLRFYTWAERAVSLGYFQSLHDFSGSEPGDPAPSVVRRLTGGGAVTHGQDLTFSITAKLPCPWIPGAVKESYLKINEAVRVGLVPIYPKIDYADCRSVSSMRARQKERICFEQADCHDLLLEGKKILGASQRRIGAKFLYQSSLFLKDPSEKLIPHLISGFEKVWGVSFEERALSFEETERAQATEYSRYSDPEWASPVSARREVRTSC